MIVIVDDEAYVRTFVRCHLEHAGCEVVEAANGPEALSHIAALQRDVELLICDINMPCMDGIELAGSARSANPSLPILLVSGRFNDKAERFMSQNPSVYRLDKPFNPRQLRAKIVGILGISSPAAGES